MGKVDCVGEPGWQCWFWSQDHREAHFHVKSPGEWEVRVFFGEDPPYYDVVWATGRIPSRRMKRFLSRVATNRSSLFEEWNSKVTVVDHD